MGSNKSKPTQNSFKSGSTGPQKSSKNGGMGPQSIPNGRSAGSSKSPAPLPLPDPPSPVPNPASNSEVQRAIAEGNVNKCLCSLVGLRTSCLYCAYVLQHT